MTNDQKLFARDVARLIQFIFEHGHSCTLGEAYRPPEHHYCSDVHDFHAQRLAIDLEVYDEQGRHLTENRYYEEFGIYWESLSTHNRWGGHFQSRLIEGNHFERRP